MSAQGLSSRAIIGEYYATLEANDGLGWVAAISNYFTSDQESEIYKWLGQVPMLREWVGGRHAKGFRENGIEIKNLPFEATIEVLVKEMKRDKTGQVMLRIRELATRTNSHWAKLLSTLIINGESTACYDGQYFFDTDHSEGDSGTQSNDISVDISELAVTNHGSASAPSVAEMRETIMQSVQQIYGFKDDQGEPLNETAKSFLVMTPVSLFTPALSASVLPMVDQGESNIIPNSDLNITVVSNPRMTWTDKIATFRTDAGYKSLIRQEEEAVQLKVKAEGSEYEFDNNAHQYGVDASRNVGYGMWQGSCLTTMT